MIFFNIPILFSGCDEIGRCHDYFNLFEKVYVYFVLIERKVFLTALLIYTLFGMCSIRASEALFPCFIQIVALLVKQLRREESLIKTHLTFTHNSFFLNKLFILHIVGCLCIIAIKHISTYCIGILEYSFVMYLTRVLSRVYVFPDTPAYFHFPSYKLY